MKGFSFWLGMSERFSECKNYLFRRKEVCSLMSWLSSTMSNVRLGQKDRPFSSRQDCVSVSLS